MVLNFRAIVLGKFLFGVAAGGLHVAGAKMLDETVPVEMLGAFGIATNIYICLGIKLATLIGIGLPKEHDVEAYK